MKQLVKKNQFIITALAIMIAVAGYLKYAESTGAMNEYLAVNNMQDGVGVSLNDISDEDILAENQAVLDAVNKETGLLSNEAEGEEDILTDIASLDLDLENTDAADVVNSNPGEAVLTNSQAVITQMKLNREQVRSANKESLNEIVNNVNVTEEQKQAALNELLTLTNIAEKEAAAEMLLQAKGFTDVVVSINDGAVDVVVNMSELSDADRAQIEDIVKRKTEITAENIVITPVKEQE